MEQPWENPARKRYSFLWPAVILAALAVLGGVVFGVNRFSMILSLNGEEQQVVEYGVPYSDPGVTATVRGSLLFQKGWSPDVQVTVEGEVDPNRLGFQKMEYSASYHGLTARVTRSLWVVDSQCPVITLHTDPGYTWNPGEVYREEGFTAWDNRDGDITHRVRRVEEYGQVAYTVLDSSGNPGYARREIPEYDYVLPELTLEGEGEMTISAGTRFQDPGCSAEDNVDGDLSGFVAVDGEVVWYKKGTYTLTYSVTDSHGNTSAVERTVHVTPRPRQETVDPGSKVIYLTFDDGPGPYTMELLDLLDSYDVQATFFVVNRGYYEVLKEMADRGHSIGVHTMSHSYRQIYASPEAFFDDLYGMQKIIEEQTGVKTWLMRFPGGSSNTVSRFNEGIMTTLTEAVEEAGFHYFDWNVDSNDAGGAKKAETVYENVTEGVQKHTVSIVLQHDIHPYSVNAVEDILIWGFENGYTFLPLREDSPTVHHGLNN